MDQLTQIMKVTGTPGSEFIGKLESPEVTAQINRKTVQHLIFVMWFGMSES